jgi:hypothetical protein
VRFLDQGYARIILSTILNLRIISIKRFVSRVNACVPMHSQTLHKRPSDVYSVCEWIGTAQQYFVRKMFCINTDLANSKNELKTAK